MCLRPSCSTSLTSVLPSFDLEHGERVHLGRTVLELDTVTQLLAEAALDHAVTPWRGRSSDTSNDGCISR